MQRLNIKRSDNIGDLEAAQKTMVSAFVGKDEKLVIVAVNYENTKQEIALELGNAKKIRKIKTFLTTAEKGVNMRYSELRANEPITLPARSITTLVIDSR